MSLTPRLVAIQGIGFTPIQIAVQGLLEELEKREDTGGPAPARAKGNSYKAYFDSLNDQYERKLRLERDDMLATEFIMALLNTEILDGTI